MKLLYISNGITGSGGLERVLSVKALMLAEDFEYEVHIISLNEKNKMPFFSFSTKIHFHTIDVSGNSLRYFLQYKNGLQNIVNLVKPDLISVCDDGLKGFFLPRIISTKAKWIYERHVSKLIEHNGTNNIVIDLLTKFKWFLMEKLAGNFDRFIVLTEGNKKEWTSLKNLEVIPNPLSFYPEGSSALDQKTVICVGKICYQKGQDLLIEIWDLVWKKHPDWKLELYGTADETFLNTSHLSEKNIYHFPAVKDIEQKYLDSSIYAMTSRFEGFGMVLIEAMACGVPCVSFNCDYGPGDIITNDEDGFLVEKEDLNQFAEKLLFLIENEEVKQRTGKTAKLNVRDFDPGTVVKKWDLLFKNLMN